MATDFSEADIPIRTLVVRTFQAVFAPRSYIAAEAKHNEIVNRLGRSDESVGARLHTLRNAMFASFAICFGSSASAILLAAIWTPGSTIAAAWIIGGTILILWATLAVRGWDIQSNKGVTLSEQVNQFIFRCSYCVGTFAIVYGTLSAVFSEG